MSRSSGPDGPQPPAEASESLCPGQKTDVSVNSHVRRSVLSSLVT